MKSYDHEHIEKKWQEKWESSKIHETSDVVEGKDNEYLLVEFPYPSGNLHIGHWYAFAVPDMRARYLRMNGKNVLYPIGFDAFGLPAENAAIKRGLDPRKWTHDNIAFMERQLKSMGNSFDWSRKVITCEPEYYKWTQWLFLQLHQHGLAYKKMGTVPWCESCKTVLANEQIVNGACERCSTLVEQKDLSQWYFKITAYADKLLDDLVNLDWPEEIKRAQREWIGRSEGALLKFRVTSNEYKVNGENAKHIEVFTTRPDTLYGVTYVVLAPEHVLVQELKDSIENWDAVSAYVQKTKGKKELERKEGKEKTGVELKGVKAINPANGEEVPVWIADYVLASYGTGAVMAVPAHDERDWEFAKKYGLAVRQVVRSNVFEKVVGSEKSMGSVFEGVETSDELPYVGSGFLVNSAHFNGLPDEGAKAKITTHVGGTMTTQYRLRDWLLSRQRYWGAPIPIVYDPEGNPHPIPPEHLPWKLPDDVDFTPTGTAPLAKSKELQERTERIFGKGWTPEVDTMDTFVCSSWYFLRYLDPHNGTSFSSLEKQRAWMPVRHYSGGAEHTTMHVLYSRFFYKALYELGLVTHGEPYEVRMNRGLILGPDGLKMSKSKGNVVDPDEHVKRVGADTVRMYLAFVGPYNEVGYYPWDLGGIAGVRRFLERVWSMRERVDTDVTKDTNADVLLLLHQTIKKVGEDIQSFKCNTAVSQMMILVNALEKLDAIPTSIYEPLIRLLAPFAPHITEELWESLGHTTSVHTETWPTYDKTMLARAHITVTVQVNGKMRATFTTSPDTDDASLVAQAKVHPGVVAHIKDAQIAREIVVKGRVVNFVLAK